MLQRRNCRRARMRSPTDGSEGRTRRGMTLTSVAAAQSRGAPSTGGARQHRRYARMYARATGLHGLGSPARIVAGQATAFIRSTGHPTGVAGCARAAVTVATSTRLAAEGYLQWQRIDQD